jgi:hypothetical protein
MTTFPTVNLNGTSRQTLINDYQEALFAVRTAQVKLAAVEFNGRDYQQNAGDWVRARCERTAMSGKLRSVIDYLEAHLEHLCN